MGEEDKKIREEHISFPDPRCLVYFEKKWNGVEKQSAAVAASLREFGISLDALVKQHERTARTVHGENFDNGMVQAVREHTKALQDLEKLPNELRKMVTKWGFYVLGANGAVSVVAIAIILKLVQQ